MTLGALLVPRTAWALLAGQLGKDLLPPAPHQSKAESQFLQFCSKLSVERAAPRPSIVMMLASGALDCSRL